MNSYQNPATGQKYLEYLNSPDGLFQQKLLGDAILKHLPEDRSLRILDAACGSGWFTFELSKKFEHTQGFDSSEFLLHQAKQQHPELNIIKANLLEELPYPDNYFDVIILNMAITDVEDIAKLFSNLSRILKPNGKLITTIPNPSYAFPVGVWKRGLLRWVFRLKPVLKIRPWKKI
jgi:ubiquinone/menaquinone biosynthesis C-methylase UbiE